MNLVARLKELGFSLPAVSNPGGNYTSVNVRGKIAYVAIQFPIINEKFYYQGKLGTDISTEEGYKAMAICSLNVLAQIESKIGFSKIEGLNDLDIYYQAAAGWDDAPIVCNGASDLFVSALGDKGIHSRSIVGVHSLPRNFCIGLKSSFTLI